MKKTLWNTNLKVTALNHDCRSKIYIPRGAGPCPAKGFFSNVRSACGRLEK
jgi:hypothetical protein